jgi:hypothetical protein
MKRLFDKLSNFSTVIKPLAVAFACALIIFSNTAPAMAFGFGKGNLKSTPSKKSDGLEQLDTVQRKSEEAITTDNSNALEKVARDDVKNAQNGGLNGVQGKADIENMKTPANAKGTDVESAIEKVLD